jgi:acyl-coenzyme A thioesterase PaaI-like protein
MNSETIPIPRLENSGCFACGGSNPVGLKMSFFRQRDAVCSELALSRNHVGWENMAHGGIISTLLDEIMSWTLICFKKSFPVTRRMTVRYLRPVPVEAPLTVRGRIPAEGTERSCRAEAAVFDAEGNTLARAEGEFALLSGDRLRVLPEELKREMERLFETLA